MYLTNTVPSNYHDVSKSLKYPSDAKSVPISKMGVRCYIYLVWQMNIQLERTTVCGEVGFKGKSMYDIFKAECHLQGQAAHLRMSATQQAMRSWTSLEWWVRKPSSARWMASGV